MSVISSIMVFSNPIKPYKERKTLDTRSEEISKIKLKYPHKIPIIIERYCKENELPCLKKIKFLVPHEFTMSDLMNLIRCKLKLNKDQAIFFLVNQKNITSNSKSLFEIYNEFKDEDGFLYITYASQQTYGN